jgi:hypothetical protein
MITKAEFLSKHNELDYVETTDVLSRIASNLSDLHIEKTFFTPEEMDQKLNNLKQYIFDYQDVLRLEKYQENRDRSIRNQIKLNGGV